MDRETWTTAEHLDYNRRLIQYTLMQAHADGRPLRALFGNQDWVANVTARFAIYEGKSDDPEWQDLIKRMSTALLAHTEPGGIDAATVGI